MHYSGITNLDRSKDSKDPLDFCMQLTTASGYYLKVLFKIAIV